MPKAKTDFKAKLTGVSTTFTNLPEPQDTPEAAALAYAMVEWEKDPYGWREGMEVTVAMLKGGGEKTFTIADKSRPKLEIVTPE